MTNCPKCGFELAEGAAECPACGIVLAKYREREEAPDPRAYAAQTAPPAADEPNPYAPPGAPLVAPGEAHAEARSAGITGATLDALESARPWLRFIVGYGFVITVLMILAAVGLMLAGVAGNQELGPLALIYVVYGGVGLLMLVPLRRSSVALRELGRDDPSEVVERFMVSHASFWRRTGILTAISLVLVVVAFVVGMIAGAMNAAG